MRLHEFESLSEIELVSPANEAVAFARARARARAARSRSEPPQLFALSAGQHIVALVRVGMGLGPRADGVRRALNSDASSSRLRPARTRATILRRYSGGYGGLFRYCGHLLVLI